MRARLPILLVVTSLAGAIACTLNPQPLPPEDREPNGGSTGTSSSSGGSGAVPSEGGDAGATDGAVRVDGGLPDAGDGGDGGDAGDAGTDAGDASDGE